MSQNPDPLISISEQAISEVLRSFEQEGLSTEEYRLRVGANKGGCSGWRWELETESKSDRGEKDLIFSTAGPELIVDEDILKNVIGTALIDYSQKNIVEQGFMFIRQGGLQCGCGESFTPISEEFR